MEGEYIMKEYMEPEMKIVELATEDIMGTSGGFDWGDDTGDAEST